MITERNCKHAITETECDAINQRTEKPYKNCPGPTCRSFAMVEKT